MTFRSEMIGQALKELRKEQEELQGKLADQRNKRRQQEQVHENVAAKLSHTRELNHKIQETYKVAQHKEAQTQIQASSFEEEISKYRQRTSETNQTIEAENERKLTDLQTFEVNLTEIKEKLMWAKEFYESESLNGRIYQLAEEYANLHNSVTNCEDVDANLCDQLGQLQVNGNLITDIGADIAEDAKETLREFCQNESTHIQHKLQELTSGLESAQRALSEVMSL